MEVLEFKDDVYAPYHSTKNIGQACTQKCPTQDPQIPEMVDQHLNMNIR